MNFSRKLVLPAIMALTACGSGEAGGERVTVESEADELSSGGWVTEHSTDPLNDASMSIATATIDASGFGVRATITCVNQTRARFNFEFTDRLGNPAPLNVQVGQRPFGGGPVEAVALAVRIDDERPFLMAVTNIGINSAMIESNLPGKFASHFRDNKLVAANKLLLRFPMSGNKGADVTIDMTDPVLQEAIGPCAEKMRAAFDSAAVRSPEPASNKPQELSMTELEQARRAAEEGAADAAAAEPHIDEIQ